ncbi:MAG: hypothetical protein WAV73_00455 [Candidatus Moraniibacteriota bacterium]
MLGDSGIGNAIVSLIYFILAIVGVVGAWIFLRRRIFLGAFFWISSLVNFFFYLYFMGYYRLYPHIIYPIVNRYWPWINLGLFSWLIINFFRNKNVKAKND